MNGSVFSRLVESLCHERYYQLGEILTIKGVWSQQKILQIRKHYKEVQNSTCRFELGEVFNTWTGNSSRYYREGQDD